MSEKEQLTSVKLPETLFRDFKISGVKHKFKFQQLVERSMFLYLTNEDFRKQIHNVLDTTYQGSN
jgi:hypothetical protein